MPKPPVSGAPKNPLRLTMLPLISVSRARPTVIPSPLSVMRFSRTRLPTPHRRRSRLPRLCDTRFREVVVVAARSSRCPGRCRRGRSSRRDCDRSRGAPGPGSARCPRSCCCGSRCGRRRRGSTPMKWLSVAEPFDDPVGRGVIEQDADVVVRGRELAQDVVARVHEQHTDIEFPDRATAMVTPLWPAALLTPSRNWRHRRAEVVGVVAVDGVAVEVEPDVVGADHQPVADAVGEVVVQGRVPGDRVTATHGARRGRVWRRVTETEPRRARRSRRCAGGR